VADTNGSSQSDSGEKKRFPVRLGGIVWTGTYLVLFTLALVLIIWRVIPGCDVGGLVATGFTPSQALIAGGEVLRIAGEGFARGATVRFGSAAPVEASIVSPFEMTVITPKSAAPGRMSIAIVQGDLPPLTVPGTFEYIQSRPTTPVVKSISPRQVLTVGSEQVRILGDRFKPGARIQVGKLEPVPALFVNSSELVLTTSKQDVGVVDITLHQETESSTLAAGLEFVQSRVPAVPLQITTVEPATASVNGGDAVTITGTGFTADTIVRFGGLPARSVRVDGSRFITAVVPMHPVGAVSVLVAGPESASVLDGRFSYVCAPPNDNTMVLLVLLAGALGGLVHALRSFFWYVGEQELVWNWIPMYVLLPFSSSGLGFVFYLVIRAGLYQPTGGTSYLLVGLAALVGMFSAQAAEKLKKVAEGIFTEVRPGSNAAPAQNGAASSNAQATITVTPASGTTAGGNTVTVTGTGFAQGTTVRFDTTPSPQVTQVSATTLKAVVPARSTAGAVDVGVTVPGKTEVVKKGGYTYTAPKGRITAVTPKEGGAAGGTTVTVTGEKFPSDVSVMFGEKRATGVKVTGETSIEVTTPPQPTGAVDVRVEAGADLIGVAPGGFTYR